MSKDIISIISPAVYLGFFSSVVWRVCFLPMEISSVEQKNQNKKKQKTKQNPTPYLSLLESANIVLSAMCE